MKLDDSTGINKTIVLFPNVLIILKKLRLKMGKNYVMLTQAYSMWPINS